MTDYTHLDALMRRLVEEKARLAKATKPAEIEVRKVWVAQIEKEIANEHKFLGVEDISDDELMAQLLA